MLPTKSSREVNYRMLAFLVGGMLVLWGLAQVSGGLAGGSGITSGLSNFRTDSTRDFYKIQGAVDQCLEKGKNGFQELLPEGVYTYQVVMSFGEYDDAIVQLADDKDGTVALVLSGEASVEAPDGEYDVVGTWKCVARYRGTDSYLPRQVDVEVVGL